MLCIKLDKNLKLVINYVKPKKFKIGIWIKENFIKINGFKQHFNIWWIMCIDLK